MKRNDKSVMELLYEKQLAEVVTQRLQGELEVAREEVRAARVRVG